MESGRSEYGSSHRKAMRGNEPMGSKDATFGAPFLDVDGWGVLTVSHTDTEPGTYFPAVRITHINQLQGGTT
jgi:hypothetical protein